MPFTRRVLTLFYGGKTHFQSTVQVCKCRCAIALIFALCKGRRGESAMCQYTPLYKRGGILHSILHSLSAVPCAPALCTLHSRTCTALALGRAARRFAVGARWGALGGRGSRPSDLAGADQHRSVRCSRPGKKITTAGSRAVVSDDISPMSCHVTVSRGQAPASRRLPHP